MSTHRGARATWLVLGSVLVVAALGMGTVNAVSALAHEEHDERRTISQPVARVDVDLDHGSLTVERAPTARLVIALHVSEGLRYPDHSERVVGDRLVIRSSCAAPVDLFCSVDYHLQVPAGTSITATTDHAGIRVHGIRGPVALSSDHGSIEVTGATGRIVMRSDHGSITATDLDATEVEADAEHGSIRLGFTRDPRAVRAESAHGDVTIEIPDTTRVAYDVEATADDGSTHVAVRTDPDAARTIAGHTTDGDVTVRYRV